MKIALKYYGLTLAWALFIFVLCSIKMGDVGGSPMFFPGFDKLTHCGLFFVLVVLYCTGYLKKHSPANLNLAVCVIIIIAAFVYGGAIELLQAYVFTWRSGEWPDLFADTLGACMAIFSVYLTQLAIKNDKA